MSNTAAAAATNTQTQANAETAGLTESLMGPASPTTPHGSAGAQRAMGATEAWKPALDRRQSWNKEEHKHELQMTGIRDVNAAESGFTERR